jgi:hypothetical protein
MKKITTFLFILLSSASWSNREYDITREYNEPNILATILSLIIPIGIPLLWLITVVIILKSEFESPVDKLIWIILSFVPVVGPVLFFVIGTKQRLKSDASKE